MRKYLSKREALYEIMLETPDKFLLFELVNFYTTYYQRKQKYARPKNFPKVEIINTNFYKSRKMLR